MTRLRAFLLALFAAAVATCALAGIANACTLPGHADGTLNGAVQETSGNFTADQKGDYVQIPFNVVPGTTGIRIQYCYDQPKDADNKSYGTTLDMGIYEPLKDGDTDWGMAESRGWSGSAVKDIGIAVNGNTDPATYNAGRKAYVSGRTTRAYQPGAIPAGTWATELGLGWLPSAAEVPGGIDWTIRVTTTTDGSWSDHPFVPDNYRSYVANPNPGWYDGDLHVHGEEEPGNALMTQTFDKGFDPEPSGNGLDFMTMVDHNNKISRSIMGHYGPDGDENDWPGKLIMPGTEETTYKGHFNDQGTDILADFRTGPIYRFDDSNGNHIVDPGELSQVRATYDPSQAFTDIDAAGGWSQINHPTIFENAPSFCRGCYWNYSAAQTDYSKVDAIEVSTGTAVLPAHDPPTGTAPNPFLAGAIQFYEDALATGNHIAAVASSDDHKGGDATGPTDSQVGRGATAVYADQLSDQGVIDAVKAGHTYAKPFGPDAPDVTMTASSPGQADAMPGDSINGPRADIAVNVRNAGAGAVRPGPYTLEILRDGVMVDSVAINSDDFNHTYTTTTTGRYSFEVSRTPAAAKLIEDYSTPIWVLPSKSFKVIKKISNKRKGTAKVKVKVESPGTIALNARHIKKSTVRVKKANQVVTLKVKTKGKKKKRLKKKGRLKVKVKLTNQPIGGETRSIHTKVRLKLKKKHKKHRHGNHPHGKHHHKHWVGRG